MTPACLRQLCAVTEDLQAYLSGEFSLSDAVRELKACRRQLVHRDAQLEHLTALTNTLQIHATDVTDENEQLRYGNVCVSKGGLGNLKLNKKIIQIKIVRIKLNDQISIINSTVF